MTEKPYSLSVIIIARDEEDRIETCLRSVSSIADEIIVLDSGSKDKTVEIAQKYTDRVYETDWPGYGIQKQRALEKAGCEWVLSIDADEALTPELQLEIDRVLASNPVETGFKLPWAVTIFGQRLNYGQSARAPLRLFKRAGARFSDSIVHEKVLPAAGKINKLKGRLLHYSNRDFGHYLHKNRIYAWLWAQRKFKAGNKGFGVSGAFFRSIWTFLHIYFLRLGILDGRLGFLVAIMYSQYSFNKYAGLWTLRRQRRFIDERIQSGEN